MLLCSLVTIIGAVLANDVDGTYPNNGLQYFIQSGAMDDFAIKSSDGEIYVQINTKLDRETTPNYNITIVAIDQGSPPRNGSTHVFIDILDVNDELPTFNKSNYGISIFENETIGSKVITCQATDKDIDHNLKYSILEVSATNETGGTVNSALVKVNNIL